jgi:hypothetical protein
MEESGRYRDLEKKLYDLQNDFRIQFVRMKLQAKESKAYNDGVGLRKAKYHRH